MGQKGPRAPLHAFTPNRIDYFLRAISRFFPIQTRMLDNAIKTLGGLKILDIGCGGGLLAEPLARLGASVTGIDVTEAAISAANAHAKTMQLSINYQTISADELAKGVSYLSSAIEHVADRQYS